MPIFKPLAAAVILCALLLGQSMPVQAETGTGAAAAASDARAALGSSLTALLVAERAGLAAIPAAGDVTATAGPVTRGDSATPALAAPAPVPVTATHQPAAPSWFRRRTPDAAPASDRFELEWLLAQPAPARTAELDCLATALYFEARGEGPDGQAAVAEVILNRTGLPGFPRSVCAVVRDGAGDGAGGCQFSYACDGRSDVVTDRASYAIAERIAAAMMAGAPRALTDGATHFHSDSVRPGWASRFAKTARIGEHTFYRMPIRTASN